MDANVQFYEKMARFYEAEHLTKTDDLPLYSELADEIGDPILDLGCGRGGLTRALEPHVGRYDFVIIDCPPSLNMLTLNALAAADAVLVPLQCEFFALEGLAQLLSTVEEIRVRMNPKLRIHGVVLTMYDQRPSLSDQVVDDVRAVLGDKVYTTVIPRNVRVAESPSHGKPVLLYDYKCTGSQAYIQLASEVIERERRIRAA